VAKGFAGLACVAMVLASGIAHAQQTVQPGFALDTFDPAARGGDWFVLDSLDFRDDGRGALGVVGEYAYKPLVVKNADGSDRAAIVQHEFVVHPGGSLIILDRLRLSFDVPIVVDAQGQSTTLNGTAFVAPDKPSLGDAVFAGDIRIFGRYGEVVTGAVGLEAIAPTGSRDLYSGDGKARFVPRLELAGITKYVEWAARGGVLFRVSDEAIAGHQRGDGVVFGASVGYRGDGGKLVVGPEIYGATSFTQASAANTPVEALASIHYLLAPEWRVGFGIGPGFGSGLGTPLLRTVLSIEFASAPDAPRAEVAHRELAAHDRDKDGIPDTIDACPDVAGPSNIDPALNGCPPPADRDKDGVTDNVDACPDEPGSPNADPEQNGCPPDADNDGIPDSEDKCPLRAGVEQVGTGQNGCPPDSDRDGIPDADDACPDVPGAVSKNPQENGCPFDPDRDHDGILNDDDACPNEAGPRDPDPQKNGCPRAILRGGEIRILDQVRFDEGSARITKGKASTDLLNDIAKVLVQHPEIKKLEVQGHTDNHGDTKRNKKLSEDRAKAVVKSLVGLGLAASRFTATGYGDERPIDSNETDAGRKANRRVEFHVTEQDALPPPPAHDAKTPSPKPPESTEKKP
jgi:outer membrane protein OmpA-like peptidoglycan-associated protein